MIRPAVTASRFPLGRVVATPGALALLATVGADARTLLDRHAAGDWGDLDDEDRRANEHALRDGARILSAYAVGAGERLWIITEADRSSTCVLRPDEY